MLCCATRVRAYQGCKTGQKLRQAVIYYDLVGGAVGDWRQRVVGNEKAIYCKLIQAHFTQEYIYEIIYINLYKLSSHKGGRGTNIADICTCVIVSPKEDMHTHSSL